MKRSNRQWRQTVLRANSSESGTVHRLVRSDRVSNYSLKDNVTGNNNLYDVRTRSPLPGGRVQTRSQLCSGVLTLDENTHIPTAKADVIGNLTPVNARVIPMEGPQEKQGAVYYFHPFWHFTVQPRAQVTRHTSKKSILERNYTQIFKSSIYKRRLVTRLSRSYAFVLCAGQGWRHRHKPTPDPSEVMSWRVCVCFARHLDVVPAGVPIAIVAHDRDVRSVFRGQKERWLREEISARTRVAIIFAVRGSPPLYEHVSAVLQTFTISCISSITLWGVKYGQSVSLTHLWVFWSRLGVFRPHINRQ